MQVSKFAALTSCTESDSKDTARRPMFTPERTALRRASPSAINGEATQLVGFLKERLQGFERMNHPNPAPFQTEDHAESDRIVKTIYVSRSKRSYESVFECVHMQVYMSIK